MVFINNRLSVCCKPWVDFLSAEMVVFDSSVKLYGVLGNDGGGDLFPSYHAGVNLHFCLSMWCCLFSKLKWFKYDR